MTESKPHHVTPAHLTSFGRITFQWAIVETLLIYVLKHLLEMETEYALITFNKMGFNDKRDIFRTLIDTLRWTSRKHAWDMSARRRPNRDA